MSYSYSMDDAVKIGLLLERLLSSGAAFPNDITLEGLAAMSVSRMLETIQAMVDDPNSQLGGDPEIVQTLRKPWPL